MKNSSDAEQTQRTPEAGVGTTAHPQKILLIPKAPNHKIGGFVVLCARGLDKTKLTSTGRPWIPSTGVVGKASLFVLYGRRG